MMGFREIRTSEKITDTFDEKNQAYKKIKPIGDETMKELDDFWAGEFKSVWNSIIEGEE